VAEITMPRLSDTMSEGTVGRWLKQPGDQVAPGDILAEIETDKATMELEAFESGVLQKIVVPEGQTVPIGEVIGVIGAEPLADGGAETQPTEGREARPPSGEAEPPPVEVGDKQIAEAQASDTANVNIQQAQTTGAQAQQPTDGRVKASPLARSMAEQNNIDLRQVQGTGPGGRIIADNVEAFMKQGGARPAAPAQPAQAPAPQPAPTQIPTPAAPASAGEVQPMSRMRRAIARAMTESKPGVPHIYVTAEIDMGEAMKLRRQINESGASDVKISVNDMVVKAAARALSRFPAINSSYAFTEDGQPGIITHPNINVSVAVATDNGLLAPVIRDADKKSIGAIAKEIRELAGRAREGKSKPSDLEGATFQTSNLGMFDVVEFVSIITVPQAASLSIGAVREVPVVRNGEIVVAQMMNVTISADHRVADGAVAAQFLQELTRLLQSPMSLLV
jgi:pyruvate dehydrogenase E2 component (dihydrolipoamide acetyltransferase)